MNRRIRIVLFVLLSWPAYTAQAQFLDKNKKIKPFVSLDSYITFVGNESSNAFGFKAGIEMDKKVRFSLGYNALTSDIVEVKRIPDENREPGGPDSSKAILSMHYFPLTAEYIFYHKDPWQFTFPLNIGYGRSYFKYFQQDGSSEKIYNHGILVSDLVVTAQYRFLPWFAAGAGLGYRIELVDNPAVDTRLSNPLYSIRVRFYLDAIGHSLFPSHFPAPSE